LESLETKIERMPQKKLYIESYGCQMNFSDSEVVASIMIADGYVSTKIMEEANAVFLNTCAIRDNAEQRVRQRLTEINQVKLKRPDLIIGVLGCMAERLKTKLLEEEKMVDIVVGPDAYRDLPRLVATAESGQKAVNVFLSREETYADISPVRLDANGISAFVSIMRGCDNMCSFCVVPYTRGRERSRDPETIIQETKELVLAGYREVTLLGQNVDSYKYTNPASTEAVSFAQLLELVALVSPILRVRFSTSHPKDITEDVILTMKRNENICNYIHLPVQSGSTKILALMNRTYTREWYLNRIEMIRKHLPDVGLSSDIIAGFCNETEEDHQETLSMIEIVKYDFLYNFTYNERPGTPAAKKLQDDVPEATKKRRLQEIVDLQRSYSKILNNTMIGKTVKILIDGDSKKSNEMLRGRTDQNTVVVFPKENYKKGEYVYVFINSSTSATLLGQAIGFELN